MKSDRQMEDLRLGVAGPTGNRKPVNAAIKSMCVCCIWSLVTSCSSRWPDASACLLSSICCPAELLSRSTNKKEQGVFMPFGHQQWVACTSSKCVEVPSSRSDVFSKVESRKMVENQITRFETRHRTCFLLKIVPFNSESVLSFYL